MNTTANGAAKMAKRGAPVKNWRRLSMSPNSWCTLTFLRFTWRRNEASNTSGAMSQSMRKDRRTIKRLRIHSSADQNTYMPTTMRVSETKVMPLRDDMTRSNTFIMYSRGVMLKISTTKVIMVMSTKVLRHCPKSLRRGGSSLGCANKPAMPLAAALEERLAAMNDDPSVRTGQQIGQPKVLV